MRKIVFIITGLLLSVFALSGQEQQYYVVPVTVNGVDTLPCITLAEAEVFGYKIFKNKGEERRYNRLVRNVRIAYPYARRAGDLLIEYEHILLEAKDDRERRRIMKDLEEELYRDYGDELKKLTFTQGKILIKLIDRQTGETSFNLVKDLRGDFRAFFYQSFARIFGLNLKVHYDPLTEDQSIEVIVRMIEKGLI
ncbi:MAG TPA: DUF4294 domain-containing protein [Bacteroidales bacterium]|mgnify:CR=1 FL=1|nr:DUF4294 domain-containing protein [Bacteroidales bacterium]HRW96995.1 DUF4294 domain-containing protein [Bacteroidales bacterium]